MPTYVNGGSFAMATSRPGGLDSVQGTFVHHGGTITTLNPGDNCTNPVTLTHFHTRIFGTCIAYGATVVGAADFTY